MDHGSAQHLTVANSHNIQGSHLTSSTQNQALGMGQSAMVHGRSICASSPRHSATPKIEPPAYKRRFGTLLIFRCQLPDTVVRARNRPHTPVPPRLYRTPRTTTFVPARTSEPAVGACSRTAPRPATSTSRPAPAAVSMTCRIDMPTNDGTFTCFADCTTTSLGDEARAAVEPCAVPDVAARELAGAAFCNGGAAAGAAEAGFALPDPDAVAVSVEAGATSACAFRGSSFGRSFTAA